MADPVKREALESKNEDNKRLKFMEREDEFIRSKLRMEMNCLVCLKSMPVNHNGIYCSSLQHHICPGECSNHFICNILSSTPFSIPVMCPMCPLSITEASFEQQLTPKQSVQFAQLQHDTKLLFDQENDPVTGAGACPQVIFQKRIENVIEKCASRACPTCGLRGYHDNECTHIKCQKCSESWCYICGEKLSHIFLHNDEWQIDNGQCPLYFSEINNFDKDWNTSGTADGLSLFHKLLTEYHLFVLHQEVGESAFYATLVTKPALMAGFSKEIILKGFKSLPVSKLDASASAGSFSQRLWQMLEMKIDDFDRTTLDKIVLGMRESAGNVIRQTQCCFAIRRILLSSDFKKWDTVNTDITTPIKSVASFNVMHIFDATEACMTINLSDPLIQRFGCEIFSIIAFQNVQKCLLLIQSRCIAAILKAMQHHIYDKDVQHLACVAIRIMASQIPFEDTDVTATVIQSLLFALESHAREMEIQLNVFVALLVMSSISEKCCHSIIAGRGYNFMTEAIAANRGNANFYTIGKRAVKILSKYYSFPAIHEAGSHLTVILDGFSDTAVKMTS